MEYDLLIIGAGPAGLSAAIYGARAGLTCAIIDKDAPGGKILKTSEIENYPGINSVSGPDLALSMLNHALSFNVTLLYGKVVNLKSLSAKRHQIECEDGNTYYAKSIIIATGTVEKELGIPGEKRLYGHGISYCAICDGALYKNKIMVVIGGGNSALHEALALSRFAKKVYLVHRRKDFKGDQKTVEKVLQEPKIELLLDTVALEIIGTQKVEAIKLQNLITKEEQIIETSVVFPFIGLNPESRLLDQEAKNATGYIVVDQNMQTARRGVFAAGDVTNKNLRQIVTACNDGAIAALQVFNFLQNEE